ncbi:MAG: sigma-70 family RNA polymerase sigma factor, partial [Pseudomonadota bacterium]
GIRARLNDQVMAPDIAVETDPRTPELALVAREELERVYDILATMDVRRREIFMLRRIDGLSHKEIAAKFGISRPAVSRHLSKAVAAIGASLSED